MEFVGRFAAFFLLASTSTHAGYRLAAATVRGGSLAERLLGTAICTVGLISLVVLGLGVSGLLLLPAALVAHVAVWAAILRWTRGSDTSVSWSGLADALGLRRGSRTVGVAFWGAVAVLGGTAWVGLFRPDYDYDTLTNHLFAPARWLQMARVALVETPFGAPTAAYEPMNTELLYAWLMLPFHSDLVARFGQALHLAIVYLSLYVLARGLGLARAPAAVAPLALHVSVPLVAQAAGAMVDLALAAWWTAALALAVSSGRVRDRGSAGVIALALGLFAGTKFVAVAYTPVLVVGVVVVGGLLPLARAVAPAESCPATRASASAGLALAGVLLGGFWYVRNFVLAGNPLFPVRIEVAAHEILPGAFGTGQLEAWVFNRNVPGLAWGHFVEQLGEALGRGAPGGFYGLPVIPLGCVAAALVVIALRRSPVRSLPAAAVLLCAALNVAIHWFVLPSHAARFIFPALALWTLVPAILAGTGRAGGVAVAVVLAVHGVLSWRYYFEALPPPWVFPLVALPVVAGLAARGSGARPRAMLPWFAATALATGLVVTKVAYERPLIVLDREFRSWGALGEAWAWVGHNIDGARIAYAGHNIPYFLLGSRFQNEVFYVNTDARGGSYHDYFRRFRDDYAEPFTPEPAYYRMELDESAWLANLAALRADHLFVASLSWNERVNHRHSRDGFVAEEAWARGQSALFESGFQNPRARCFALDPRGKPRPASPPERRVEIDAVELYLRDAQSLDRWYPGARPFIEQGRLADYARQRASAPGWPHE